MKNEKSEMQNVSDRRRGRARVLIFHFAFFISHFAFPSPDSF